MKSYIGSKIIQAEEMDDRFFLKKEKGQVLDCDARPGYKVVYPDGYVSWAPKNVFENAYREVTDGEKKLINS